MTRTGPQPAVTLRQGHQFLGNALLLHHPSLDAVGTANEIGGGCFLSVIHLNAAEGPGVCSCYFPDGFSDPCAKLYATEMVFKMSLQPPLPSTPCLSSGLMPADFFGDPFLNLSSSLPFFQILEIMESWKESE